MKKAKYYVGTSGYVYNHWGKGVFYPANLPQNKWLEYYTSFFDTVELNVTFYRLPAIQAFKSWYKRTSSEFSFIIKGSRFITHIKRLDDCREPLKLFFDRASSLKEKLAVVLWQLPPKFKADATRLSNFIKEIKKYSYCRHAFEFRHEDWFSKEIISMLKENNMALCLADWPEFALKYEELTADFVYLRRHKPSNTLYGGNYSQAQLTADARKIKQWLRNNKDVYIFFNNDAHGWAVKNALTLKKLLE